MVRHEAAQAQLMRPGSGVAAGIMRSDAAEAMGWASAKDFLTAVTGGQKGSGPALVRLVERLEGLPATLQAMREGWLSQAKATVISQKIATLPHHAPLREAAESLLLAGARSLDATDLARSWPAVVKEIDPDGTLLGSELALDKLERAAHRTRHLSFVPDGYGGVRIRGYASLEEAELVKETLMARRRLRRPSPVRAGVTRRLQRAWSTGLRDAARVRTRSVTTTVATRASTGLGCGTRWWMPAPDSQTTNVLPQSHGAPVRLMVTTSIDQLAAALDQKGLLPGGTLPGGDAVSAAVVRRMACDAEILPAVLGTRDSRWTSAVQPAW